SSLPSTSDAGSGLGPEFANQLTHRLQQPVSHAPPPGLPRTFGSYLLLAEIGRGGMGVVYKARHLLLNRLVAVKMIDATLRQADQLLRFRKEAEAIAQLNHPNIVDIYEVGEHEGKSFFALEYVDGQNLAQHTTHALPPAQDAAVLVRVLAQAI